MEFFESAVDALQVILSAVGLIFALLGIVHLLEGYGSENPGAKSSGGKQLIAGIGIVFIAQTLVPQLSGVFSF